MHKLRNLTLAIGGVAVAGTLSAYAQGAPEKLIYRVPGVFSNGFVATVVSCSNLGNVQETIRLVIRDRIGNVLINDPQNVGPFASRTWETWLVNGLTADATYNVVINPMGFASIATTSPQNTFCAARIVSTYGTLGNATASNTGWGMLEMIKVNPIPNAQ